MLNPFQINVLNRREGGDSRDMIASVQFVVAVGAGPAEILKAILHRETGLWTQACINNIHWDHLVIRGALPQSVWVALGARFRGWNFDGCSLAIPGDGELVVLQAHRWKKDAGSFLKEGGAAPLEVFTLHFEAGPLTPQELWDLKVTCTTGVGTPNFTTLVGTVPELIEQLGERFCSFSRYPIPRPQAAGPLGGNTRLTLVGDFAPALALRLGWALSDVSVLYVDTPNSDESMLVTGEDAGCMRKLAANS